MAVFMISAALIMNISLFFAPFSYAEEGEESVLYAEALAGGRSSAEGSFRLGKLSRFYIVTEEGKEPDKDTLDTVSLISSMFASCGIPSEDKLLIFYGEERYTMPGDIVLRTVQGNDPQEYTLEVTDRAVISSPGTDGIYYGLLSLLETFIETHKKSKISMFSLKDKPDMAERAVFLDCGRKYFTPDWIKALIRRCSVQRYNALILHFSEAEGLRLDSRVFPWLTDDIESLTMDEMADIVRYADQYHIKVVPSFDTPGHNRYIVSKYWEYAAEHPDFTFDYSGKTYGPDTEGFGSIANYYCHNGYKVESDYVGIDLANKYAVGFMDALIDDYASFFRELGCTDFDIGGDEVIGYASFYIGGDLMTHENRWYFVEHWDEYARSVMKIPDGSANDTFIYYLNRTASRLMNMGYTCRVFNDEIDLKKEQHLRLRPSVGISYWNAKARSAKHYAEGGYKLYNCVSLWCYYAVGTSNGRDMMYGKYYSVNGPNIFDNWDPMSYSSRDYKYRPVPEENRGGGYFCIWCDSPDYKSEELVWDETAMRTWANSAKLWNASLGSSVLDGTAQSYGKPSPYSYYELESFASLIEECGLCQELLKGNELAEGSRPLSGEEWWKMLLGPFKEKEKEL